MFPRYLLTALALILLIAGTAHGQIPDKFTNLQVFPENIGKRSLLNAMQIYSESLGVDCTHCHLETVPGDKNSIDWASDMVEAKGTARRMMQMTARLNQELLPMAVERPDQRVDCVTCHRGLTDPRPLHLALLNTFDKEGVDAAITRYRELREEYYCSGSYDFGPKSLQSVAATIAEKAGDTRGALAVADLNLEYFPDHIGTLLIVAQLHVVTRQIDELEKTALRILEIDPQNDQAGALLEMVRAGRAVEDDK